MFMGIDGIGTKLVSWILYRINPRIRLVAMEFSLQQIILPALREDICLQAAPMGRDGAPHWNLYDPVRNSFFRIGWLEFEMLSRWKEGQTAGALCAEICAATHLTVMQEDVASLLQFLQNSELLRASHPNLRDALQKISASRKLSVWQWLLHHYLFFRIPLIKPDAVL